MKVCVCAGQAVLIDGALCREGAVIEVADDEVESLIEAGAVEAIKAQKKKAAPKKKAPAKKAD
tara:strand:- start:382 stop:570 length:189 start_codon:yes stop_codon:yes gene_type:complete